MTHHQKGNFAAKHPTGTIISDQLRQAVENKSRNQSITCAAAHAIAQDLNIDPIEAGRAIDILEYRICKCQLGLFGYHPEKKIVTPASEISPALKVSITDHLLNNRLSCLNAWRLAEANNMPRLELCAVCEALKIKISPCQLGAF